MAIVGLLPSNAAIRGEVILKGEPIQGLSDGGFSDIRGRRIGVIFQDPASSLNPVFTIGYQIAECLQRHFEMAKRTALHRAIELLGEVGISDPALRAGQYPHELSGGLKQRAMIAMAISCEPELLIADEPTTALDVTIQGQVLQLLQRLCHQRSLSLILVTHDFGVVAAMADSVAVMYSGEVVEYANVYDLFESPRHPYTRALLATNPRRLLNQKGMSGSLKPIAGSPPNPLQEISGCSFQPRCPEGYEPCAASPELVELGRGRKVACWRAMTADDPNS
jgi:peptide/nickel transport system ATP-binding protein